MAGLFDTLNIASTGIQTSQWASQVTSHNVTNAATAGFHRQEAILGAQVPPTMGVRVVDTRRALDSVLESRLLQQSAGQTYSQTRADGLLGVEQQLGLLEDQGLPAALDRFFYSFRQLTAYPGDVGVRTSVLANVEGVAAATRRAAQDLVDARGQADTQVRQWVSQANQKITRIADLNVAIVEAEASGRQANDLRDQRDTAVSELSQIAGVHVDEDALGRVKVFVGGGVAVVDGATARQLEVEPDVTTGLHRIFVQGAVRNEVTQNDLSGALGGALNIRDVDIPNWQNDLDQFAFDFASAVNGVHAGAVGLDGVTNRNLFAAPTQVSGAALSLSVDALVAGQPQALGAALALGTLPGDARAAQQMVDLSGQLVASGSTRTLGAALSDLVSTIGQTSQTAQGDASVAQGRLEQLQALQQSQSGVSIEEQMLALSRYQRAFQAASKVVTAVDEMFDSLMNM